MTDANLQALLDDLLSGDDQRAESAVAQLAALGAAAREALVAWLDDADLDKRWWAYRALAAFPDDDIADLLARGLQDGEAEIRQAAALGLRLHPSARHVDLLAAALEDPDAMTADLSMQALARAGKAAVPALLSVLESGSRRARLRAVRALAEIADPQTIPALMQVLENDSALMQYWADQGLDNLGLKMLYFKPD